MKTNSHNFLFQLDLEQELNQEEKNIIIDYIDKLKAERVFDKKIVTEVKPLEKFYYAEEYHQDYEVNNPNDPYILNISKPRFN